MHFGGFGVASGYSVQGGVVALGRFIRFYLSGPKPYLNPE